MGKDREGRYHPPKGKPSGGAKDEGVGLHPGDQNFLEENLKTENKFDDAPDELIENAQIRHPNRNVNKDEGDYIKKNAWRNTKGKSQPTIEITDTVTPEDMSGVFSKDIFLELAHYSSGDCVTVYIPTHRAGVEVNEQTDQLAFKNALQKISNTFKEKGKDSAFIERFLAPGYELLRNDQFWRSQQDGLAAFISLGYFRYVKMPFPPAEELIFNNSFYLNPLILLMTTTEYFYTLVISKKQAKLFRCDAFNIEPVPIEELPRGMDDVIHFEEKGGKEVFRMGDSGAGVANFHGMGEGRPDEKEHIAIYLEEVDETLWKEVLHAENVPLLLAGVEYLIHIYKQVAGYNHVWNDALTGNFEREDLHSLHRKALEKMKPYFQKRTEKVLEEFGNKSATELTSSVPADIIPAAFYSRISALLIEKNQHIWGTFDEHTNELTIHQTKQEGDDCLLDKAAIKTIQNGGEVFLLEKEQMPANSTMAAIMRF